MSEFTLDSRVGEVFDDPAGHDYILKMAAELYPDIDLEKEMKAHPMMARIVRQMTLRGAYEKARKAFPGCVAEGLDLKVEQDLREL